MFDDVSLILLSFGSMVQVISTHYFDECFIKRLIGRITRLRDRIQPEPRLLSIHAMIPSSVIMVEAASHPSCIRSRLSEQFFGLQCIMSSTRYLLLALASYALSQAPLERHHHVSHPGVTFNITWTHGGPVGNTAIHLLEGDSSLNPTVAYSIAGERLTV